MHRRVLVAILVALLTAVMAVPAVATQAERVELPLTYGWPDLDNGIAVFVNYDRDSYCTPEVFAFENAVIAWLQGGMVGDPPEPPPDYPGDEAVTVLLKDTGQGALVGHINEKALGIEIWTLDSPENRPLVGPCTDTDDDGAFLASGTTSFHSNDNDVDFSGTRSNAFGDWGTASLTDRDGNPYSYSWHFHVNSRCYAPEGSPPACLIEMGTLTAG